MLIHFAPPLTADSVGSKDEDKQLTELLKEEEAQISQRILALKKDVRKQIDDQI